MIRLRLIKNVIALRLRDGNILCSSTTNVTMYLVENMEITKTMKNKEDSSYKMKFNVVYFFICVF